MYHVVNNVLFRRKLKELGLDDEQAAKIHKAMMRSSVTALNTERLANAGGTFNFYALHACTAKELEAIPESERKFTRNPYDWRHDKPDP